MFILNHMLLYSDMPASLLQPLFNSTKAFNISNYADQCVSIHSLVFCGMAVAIYGGNIADSSTWTGGFFGGGVLPSILW